VGQLLRKIRNDVWLFLNATVASLCAFTIVAIHWLGALGVVREYRVAGSGNTTAEGFFAPTINHYDWHKEFGLATGGPSWRLTQIYALAWAVGCAAGLFWMLRLALRSDAYRIGFWRGFGVLSGFGLFVVTGAMHRTVEAVVPRRSLRRIHRLITAWCTTAAITSLFIAWQVAGTEPPSPGVSVSNGAPAAIPHAVLLARNTSMARAAVVLVVVVTGWALAAYVTRVALRHTHDAAHVHLDPPVSLPA
jgi:hypothetical protein